MKKFTIIYLCLYLSVFVATAQQVQLKDYHHALKTKGKAPQEYALDKIKQHDLLIFDDANHVALEPFLFYQDLLKNEGFRQNIDYIFIELFNINNQKHLDAFLNAPTLQLQLLAPVFQNELSGFSKSYQTYVDLLTTVYKINQKLARPDRVRVIAVGSPTYWPLIHDEEDLNNFRVTTDSYDYTMYTTILNYLNNFNSGKKGILLTNTRHAYKGLKDKDGRYMQNCADFFTQYKPGKTCSIRIHNAVLRAIPKTEKEMEGVARTQEGLERYHIGWGRVDNGKWDQAFKANGNKPIGFDIKDTPFGQTKFEGNQSQKAHSSMQMQDVNDGIVFLAPLENLRKSATTDIFITDDFVKELERRILILWGKPYVEEQVSKQGLKNTEEYLRALLKPEPVMPLPSAQAAVKAQ
ncbi:hypothetical protein [Pontibacter cellulosilyticus]|uniref:Uncharacterized protein n=1 Tax=Pontibacter cellulosilyticus TaxID=1720253 RepID=A0A923SK60_9BACT|nr:hypothetical protein [Pontibacter cellulosilyticus]MBC5993446.1 hypothetical protein [Pontibacter cellulosilyticus]